MTVVDPGTIMIVKEASPQGGTSFLFAADEPLGDFTLVDDGGLATERRSATCLREAMS